MSRVEGDNNTNSRSRVADQAVPFLGGRPTIGFLTASLRDPYATFTWTNVMEVAKNRDVNVLNIVGSRLRSTADEQEPEQVMFDLVDPSLIDGLVVFSEMLYHYVSVAELKQFLNRFGFLPMTSIGVVEGIPSVMLDKEEGMQQLVDHLVDVHKYRRLAYLSGPSGEQTAEGLYRGFLKGLAKHDIPFDPRLVIPNQPSWGDPIGTNGVRILLDERGLQPGLDIDCIVACGDREATTAVEALQARGVRVPYDVAVTGFNNLEQSHLACISLTTGDRRVDEVARRATEILVDIIDGQTPPPNEILPPEMEIRWSCGCIPETVRQAASEGVGSILPPASRSEDWSVSIDKNRVLAEIIRAGESALVENVPDLNSDWAERLLDGFLDELNGESPWQFLTVLEEILRIVMTTGHRVTPWQAVLSAMRRNIRPCLHDVLMVERAEDLWQQARTLLGDFAEREQGFRRLNDVAQVQIFNSIIQRLMTTFDIDGIMDVLASDLPQLGISSCFLSIYEDPSDPTKWARLMLAYDENGRIEIGHGGFLFQSSKLVPTEFLRIDRRLDLVGLPLHFHGEQLGFVILEMGPLDGNIYEALRMQISSAMKGAFLASRNEELYREAVEARKAAEAADQLKSRFLSTVSHELRTPLSLIVGTIEMQLREDASSENPLPDRYYRDLNNIRASAHHLNHLIGDVLDLASSQAGQLRLVRSKLRVSDVLAEVIALGEVMAREKGLTWQTDVPKELPYVWGDQTRLQQVTLNLVSNAVKFTRSGTISLWTEVGKDQLMVAVSDTGIGIPVEEQNAIFEEFFQSDRTVNQGFSGKGLGLAISRRLIDLHGGQVGVLSSGTAGSGATVYYTLPIIDQTREKETHSRDRSDIVLILTEHAGVKHRLQAHLQSRGFKVELVDISDQRSWSEEIVSAPPGAIILDYEPDGDRGWKVMRDLRDYLPTQDIPVVFYTLSEDRDRGALLDLDYLTKPVSSSDLARALERQGLTQELSAGDRTILIVDDDPGILDLHGRVLEKLIPRCQIISATNGREALDIMAKKTPDLVVLDLVMPIVDGFGVLQVMREQETTRNVPVIVLTAQILTRQDMVRLRRGVAAVLAKGLYSSNELLTQVETVLSRNKQLYSDTQWAMRQTMAYIHENYAGTVTRSELAAHVGLSERYLTQCFRRETGLTPIKYLNRYRIRQARIFLERDQMNVTEVAFAVGFTDPNYFARVFRDEIGISPRAYQSGERLSTH